MRLISFLTRLHSANSMVYKGALIFVCRNYIDNVYVSMARNLNLPPSQARKLKDTHLLDIKQIGRMFLLHLLS